MTSRVQASTRANASHQTFQDSPTMQKFVIGKIDAGIAVLISDSVHLIEFPSLLLPAGVGPGSIVNIACTRNLAAEKQHARDFWALQDSIAAEFAAREPTPPRLRVRNTTQASVTLEWDPLDLAAADLVNLSIYRNGQRLTTIPNPKTNTSTKLSGLQLDTDYAFHLVLKTTAGTYTSPVVKTRTHTIDNTTGISVCFGLVEPQKLADAAHRAVQELGAKADDRIQIDTTHFVATSSATKANPNGAPGPEYQKAIQLSIPVVTPEWLLACAQAKKLVPISAYYLGQTNRAASLSSAQLVNPSSAAASSTTTPPATNRTESLARVTEEREEALARPPVELEENVEAPPSDQTAATVALPASTNPSVEEQQLEPESSEAEPNPPTEPVKVETSSPDVSAAAAAEVEKANNDDDDNSSTRGVKSSNDSSSEDRTEQQRHGEEHAEIEEVSPAAPALTEEAEAEEKPPSSSPPPTISVTPPPPLSEEDASTADDPVPAPVPAPAPAPAPEGDLVEVDSEEVGGEGQEGQVNEEEEESPSAEVAAAKEEEEEEEDAGASEEGGADAKYGEVAQAQEEEEEKEGQGSTASAAETSLVDVKL